MKSLLVEIVELHDKFKHDCAILNILDERIRETLTEERTGEDYEFLLEPLRMQIDYLHKHVRELEKQIDDLRPILREVMI